MELNNHANVSSVKKLTAINVSERQGTVQSIGTASALDVIELFKHTFWRVCSWYKPCAICFALNVAFVLENMKHRKW